MDKKKLQEFIDKLQMLATELSEEPNNNTSIKKDSAKQVQKNALASIESKNSGIHSLFNEPIVNGQKLNKLGAIDEEDLIGIRIVTPPKKTVYNAGEKFDCDGMTVQAEYTNGKVKTIFDYTYSPTNALMMSDEKIIVSYGEFTAAQEIEVFSDHPYKGVFINDFKSEFVNITHINGEKIDSDSGLREVAVPGGFTVEVDFDGYMATTGFSEDQLAGCTLAIPGKVYVSDVKCYACAMDSNKRLCDIKVENDIYYIPIKKIHDLTKRANFRFFIENPVQYLDKNSVQYQEKYPHEIFSARECWFELDFGPLVSLSIESPAKKNSYLIGETFNSNGLKVLGNYKYGAVLPVEFTADESTINENDTSVTIKSGDCSVEYPIQIIGQKDITLNVKTLQRTKESSVWGDWKETSSSNVVVSKTDIKETKTIVTFKKSAVKLCNKKRTGLRLYLERKDKGYQDGISHIKINGVEHTLPVGGKKTYLYIGNVNHEDKESADEMQVEFEYCDDNVEFNMGKNPPIYFCDALDPTIQSEKKDFTLAGNVSVSVDLLHGSDTLVFNDIEAGSTLLGVGISHVFQPTEGNMYYGANFRLNLYERFEISKALDGPVPTPIYTDAVGNQYTFTIIYYYIENDEKNYLSTDGIKNITYDSDGNLTYRGHSVYTDYIKVHNFRYLTETNSTIKNNSRYKAIKAQNNSSTLPVHWIKADNLYKGFNSDGRLVMTIDEYDNYTEMSYDSYGRLTSVKDGKGNQLNLTYSSSGNMCLKKITSSRGRRIEYAYDNNNCLSTVSYYDAPTGGENYKTLTFKYVTVTIDGIETYCVCDIICSDNTRTEIEYDQFSEFEHRISKITNYSDMPDSSGESTDEKIISSLLFEYDYEAYVTTITDEDFNQEKYAFTEEGITRAYYQIYNFLVSKAELYSYTPYDKQEKLVIADELLNKYSYEDFLTCSRLCENGNFTCGTHDQCGDMSCIDPNCEDEECVDPKHTYCARCNENCLISFHKNIKTVTKLNEYNMPQKVTQANIFITDDVSKTVVTEYEYDDNLKTVKETNTETYSSGKCNKSVTEYTYDSETQFLTKKSTAVYHIVNDLEVKEFSSVEEYEYSYGCVSKTISYRIPGNYTVATNKYYTNKTYNSNKQPIEEYDVTGKYHTEISYISGTNLVSEIKSPNDHNLYYNYDNEDRVSKMWGTSDSVENANTTSYNSGEIDTLNHSGNSPIKYEYDTKRRPKKITIDGNLYETYEYEEDIPLGWYFGDAVTVTNANGERFRAETDAYGKTESAYYNGELILQRENDNFGRLWHVVDTLTGAETYITYDTCGNITSYSQSKEMTVNDETYTYNGKGQISSVQYTGEVNRTDTYEYSGNAVDYVTKFTTGNYSIYPTQDIDERYTGKTVSLNGTKGDSENITYAKEGVRATRRPSLIAYPDSFIYYTYDGNGNITKISQVGVLQAQYQYDTLGRLIREDNNVLGESYFYTYDNNGNILAKEKCAFTTDAHVVGTGTVTSYIYNKDKLMSFGGETNVYDAIGNPTTYRGKAAVWTRGRKLISYNGNTFDYDAQGARIKKNDIEYYYDSRERLLKQSNGLEFFYDTMGLVGVTYNGASYVYRKDIQGNIIALLDSNGNVVVQYKYDAWGNHKVLDAKGNALTSTTHIGNLNPFRYRSYYFDTETKLYFLKTRYYDPEVGRFINMDSIDYADPETINGLNLFAYCGNNPVMNFDPDGHAWWKWALFGAAVAVIAVAAVVATVASGGLATAACAVAVGGATAMAGNIVEQGKTKGWDNIDVGEVGIKSLGGSLYGLASTITGPGAVLAKAGEASIENIAMTLYHSEGKASAGEIIKNAELGFIQSVALQGVGAFCGKYLYNPFNKNNGLPLKTTGTDENLLFKIGLIQFGAKAHKIITDKLLWRLKTN